MELKEILFLVIAIPIVVGCLCLLWIIIRFAIISDIKTKGARDRLRFPDPEGVAGICGFRPGEDLVEFFKTAEVIIEQEFHFIDTRPSPPKGWFIGSFIPISPTDTKEWRKVSGVPGLPIADNCDGGIYYLDESGSVYLSDPRNHKSDLLVAETAGVFAKFSYLDTPDTHDAEKGADGTSH
jgi:hypothetical protein